MFTLAQVIMRNLLTVGMTSKINVPINETHHPGPIAQPRVSLGFFYKGGAFGSSFCFLYIDGAEVVVTPDVHHLAVAADGREFIYSSCKLLWNRGCGSMRGTVASVGQTMPRK